MERQIEQLEIMYPDRARGVAKFNVPLAHKIIAGSDFMVIPSRFEPCGLIQLHSMRYGTVLLLYVSLSHGHLLGCSLKYFSMVTYTVILISASFFIQVPIAASTGGLVDTVKEGFTGFHMGAFSAEVSRRTIILI